MRLKNIRILKKIHCAFALKIKNLRESAKTIYENLREKNKTFIKPHLQNKSLPTPTKAKTVINMVA